MALAIDGTTKRFFGEEKEDCIDFCGGGTNDVYRTLDELMIHLETGSSGPMHHAAAAFLRKLYYTQKKPIHFGTDLHCVDTDRVVVKQEEDDVVLPQTDRATENIMVQESGSEEEEEDGKPFAVAN